MKIGQRSVSVVACVVIVSALLVTRPRVARAKATPTVETIVFMCQAYGEINVLWQSQSAGVPSQFSLVTLGGPNVSSCAQYISDIENAGFKNTSRFFNGTGDNNGLFGYEYRK
jgi:hypothetical protein